MRQGTASGASCVNCSAAAEPAADAYFSCIAPYAAAGSLYRFQLDDERELYPGPSSRFPPCGPHGPSQVSIPPLSRDAAYHQGTVRGWLIGPYIDAYLKVYPQDKAGARASLAGFEKHLEEAGLGTISEIFDAEAPFTPRGCIAQAWSVAEMLRCWVKTEPGA